MIPSKLQYYGDAILKTDINIIAKIPEYLVEKEHVNNMICSITPTFAPDTIPTEFYSLQKSCYSSNVCLLIEFSDRLAILKLRHVGFTIHFIDHEHQDLYRNFNPNESNNVEQDYSVVDEWFQGTVDPVIADYIFHGIGELDHETFQKYNLGIFDSLCQKTHLQTRTQKPKKERKVKKILAIKDFIENDFKKVGSADECNVLFRKWYTNALVSRRVSIFDLDIVFHTYVKKISLYNEKIDSFLESLVMSPESLKHKYSIVCRNQNGVYFSDCEGISEDIANQIKIYVVKTVTDIDGVQIIEKDQGISVEGFGDVIKEALDILRIKEYLNLT